MILWHTLLLSILSFVDFDPYDQNSNSIGRFESIYSEKLDTGSQFYEKRTSQWLPRGADDIYRGIFCTSNTFRWKKDRDAIVILKRCKLSCLVRWYALPRTAEQSHGLWATWNTMFYSATTLLIIVGIRLPGITLLSRRYNQALEPMMT